MKKILLWILILCFVIIIIPLFTISVKKAPKQNKKIVNSKNITVYFTKEDECKTMPMEEYIVGVVSAEMPALFELEALKAQAVATRTYTVSKINSNKDEETLKKHKNAMICTDPAHCQAYISKDEAYAKWQNNADEYYNKIVEAVNSTAGQIITYNNEPIRAVFHSSNGGKTESAKDVWGGDFAYLKSVQSEGENLSPKYKTEYSISYDTFKNMIIKEYPDADETLFLGQTTHTEGGAVDTVELLGKKIKGTKIREMFMLKSANFEISKKDDNIIFTVYGYGHGVGMSQYGANYYAKQGKKYDEILKIYYTDTKISMYNME